MGGTLVAGAEEGAPDGAVDNVGGDDPEILGT